MNFQKWEAFSGSPGMYQNKQSTNLLPIPQKSIASTDFYYIDLLSYSIGGDDRLCSKTMIGDEL